jgi:hypothetical protein
MTNRDQPTPEEIEQRKRWFASYMRSLDGNSVSLLPRGEPYSCPCCYHLTLDERGGFEICVECDWEDDGQDDHDADIVRGGPNGSLSLTEARRLYRQRKGLDA